MCCSCCCCVDVGVGVCCCKPNWNNVFPPFLPKQEHQVYDQALRRWCLSPGHWSALLVRTRIICTPISLQQQYWLSAAVAYLVGNTIYSGTYSLLVTGTRTRYIRTVLSSILRSIIGNLTFAVMFRTRPYQVLLPYCVP